MPQKKKIIPPNDPKKSLRDLTPDQRIEAGKLCYDLLVSSHNYSEINRHLHQQFKIKGTSHQDAIKKLISEYEELLIKEIDFTNVNIQRIRSIKDAEKVRNTAWKLITDKHYKTVAMDEDTGNMVEKIISIKPSTLNSLLHTINNCNEQIAKIRGAINPNLQFQFVNLSQSNTNYYETPSALEWQKMSVRKQEAIKNYFQKQPDHEN